MAEYTLFSSGSYYIKANNKPIARLNTGVKTSSSLTIYHSIGCVVNNVNVNGTPNLEYCFTFIFDGATQLQINMPGLSGTYNASNDKNATNYKWFDCETGAANIVLNNCETDDNIYLFYSDNGMEFDEYHWLYTDFRKMRIPMTATIFTGTGPLSYSDEDYAYTYNPENYSSFAITFKEDAVKNEGGTLQWMSVQLTGENNIKTTTISGNWTSIINGGSGYPYEDGVTLVLDEIGTDLHPILKKINDDEINEYVIFDTPYLYVKINKDNNGYLKSYIKSPYEPSGSSKYISLTNISNNNPVYICYYFNAMMASKYGQSSNSPIEAMFFVEVDGQNKYIAGSIVMNQSINLTDHTYYKDFFVNSLPEFSILIEDNKKYSNEWINITDLPNPLLVGKNYNDEYFKSGDFLTSSTIYGLILNGIFVTNYLPASLFNINGEIWIYGNNQCGIKMWYESSGGYIQIAVYYNGNMIVTPGGSDGVIYAKKTQLISGDAKISLFCGIKEDRQRGSMFAIIRTGTINSFSYEMQWVSWFSRDLYNFLTITPTPGPNPPAEYRSYIDMINGSGFTWKDWTLKICTNYDRNVPMQQMYPNYNYSWFGDDRYSGMGYLHASEIYTINITGSGDSWSTSVIPTKTTEGFYSVGPATYRNIGMLCSEYDSTYGFSEFIQAQIYSGWYFDFNYTVTNKTLTEIFVYLSTYVRNVNIYVNDECWALANNS